jgi:two-component system CheB/CheR fusion protein
VLRQSSQPILPALQTTINDIGVNERMKKKPLPSRRQKKPTNIASTKPLVFSASVSFPIVGIGASAGGLKALEQFLGHVPAGSGMAFIIVQHLDPTRKGVMSELLQRITGMKVV